MREFLLLSVVELRLIKLDEGDGGGIPGLNREVWLVLIYSGKSEVLSRAGSFCSSTLLYLDIFVFVVSNERILA